MKIIGILVACFLIMSCAEQELSEKTIKSSINKTVDNWHIAAANADTTFFAYFDDDAIYIGTDATERWNNEEFRKFALPFFKKGKAWDFKPLERHIYLQSNSFAFFDEKLDTWMGVCRSTGVVKKKGEHWKIKYYHLSITIPNEKIKDVIETVSK